MAQKRFLGLQISSSVGYHGTWFFRAFLVGSLAGLGAIAFQIAGQVIVRFVLIQFSGFEPGEGHGERAFFEAPDVALSFPWLLLVLVGGGLLSGLIVYTFAPEAEGHGTDGAIHAFHHGRGNIPLRVAIVKTLASAITLGTAGSGGREGPIAQIGAALGSSLGQWLKLSARDRRILLATGMGAGVGAIFRAPLAGAIFAGEIMYRDADIESDVLIPTAVGSIVAYSVYGMFMPPELCFAHIFGGLADYSASSLLELLPYTILAVSLSAMAWLYVRIFYGLHNLFGRLPGPPHLRPAAGAFLTGLVGWALYRISGQNSQVLAVLSTGYGTLQQGLESPEKVAAGVLLVVAFCKILTTSFTIGSGGSGGVFGPSMVIGGCLGIAVGKLCGQVWPDLVNPGAFGVVGMAGFFAGCAHAPISTIIMVSEMTGSYQLLMPTMWVSTLCFLMCQKVVLYRKQVNSRLDSPAHSGDFLVDILQDLSVRDVFDGSPKLTRVPEKTPLRELVRILSQTHQHFFPVVDDGGRLAGVYSDSDVRPYLYDDVIWDLADAADIMTTEIVSVTPADDLNAAIRRLSQLGVDELPVVDENDGSQLVGVIRRETVIRAYYRKLTAYQEEAHAHAR